MNTQPTSEPNDEQGLFQMYRDLQRYVGWEESDVANVEEAGQFVTPIVDALVEDFYEEIENHAAAQAVLTGGSEQVERLKETLRQWIRELFSGSYDAKYVSRRWKIGLRHLQIGLRQIFVNAALARMQNLMVEAICEGFQGDKSRLLEIVQSLNRLLNLDLAIIEVAYESAHVSQEQEAERKRGDDRFRNLVEAAACMIVILRRDHTIAYFSPYAEILTGYQAVDVVGEDYFLLFLPAYERVGVAQRVDAVFSGEHIKGYQNDILIKNGETRSMLWNARQLDTFQGETVCLAVGQDITELRQAQETALRSERLATIGQMSAGLAHESRNALQRIQASAEVLEIEVQDNPTALDFVHRIQEAQEHVHHLYEEVRGYAATVQLDRELCSIHRICREAWQLVQSTRQTEQVELNLQFDATEFQCEVDQFRLVQVFRNLFENCIDACSEPIEVSVSCALVQLDGREAVRISVLDNGPGLDPKQRRNIFEPFFTTKPKGTGLGMAIAHRIIDAHSGVITVGDSESGTEIVITVPIAEN